MKGSNEKVSWALIREFFGAPESTHPIIHNFAACHGSDGSLNSPVQAPRLSVRSSGS